MFPVPSSPLGGCRSNPPKGAQTIPQKKSRRNRCASFVRFRRRAEAHRAIVRARADAGSLMRSQKATNVARFARSVAFSLFNERQNNNSPIAQIKNLIKLQAI